MNYPSPNEVREALGFESEEVRLEARTAETASYWDSSIGMTRIRPALPMSIDLRDRCGTCGRTEACVCGSDCDCGLSPEALEQLMEDVRG